MAAAPRYIVKRGVSGWKVHDTSRIVHGIPNLHPSVGRSFLSDRSAAQAEADRLNELPANSDFRTSGSLDQRGTQGHTSDMTSTESTNWNIVARKSTFKPGAGITNTEKVVATGYPSRDAANNALRSFDCYLRQGWHAISAAPAKESN